MGFLNWQAVPILDSMKRSLFSNLLAIVCYFVFSSEFSLISLLFAQLCVGGTWIDTVTVEMDPLDAGTDNGFTFTAPNWPTDPQGVIYRITSRYPAHPAGSFFYPKSKRLPPIATFQFIKVCTNAIIFCIVEECHSSPIVVLEM